MRKKSWSSRPLVERHLDQRPPQDQLQNLSRTITELSNRKTIHLGLAQIHLVLDYQKARLAFNLEHRTTGQNL